MAVTTPEDVNEDSAPDSSLPEEPLEEPLEELTEDEEAAPPLPVLRVALCVFFPLAASAVIAGGLFLGFPPRVYAVVGAIAGVGTAIAARLVRNPILQNLVILAGVVLAGILVVLPTGLGNVSGLAEQVLTDIASGNVLRPPLLFTTGWLAILVWLMAAFGFASAWAAIELRRPALGLLIPLPLIAFGTISVPKDQQVASGIGAIVLFAVGLGLLSGIDLSQGSEKRSMAYEMRRAIRAAPLVLGIAVALFFLSRANLLFPQPLIDPTQEARKPRAVPLSEVPDRVLFTVRSSVSGPWRMGLLDVYDGKDWKLPPFAESQLARVPESGIIDDDLEPGVRAEFVVKGLQGAVLPGLPNTVGLIATGDLAFDPRTGTIRISQGTLVAGDRYTVTAGKIPTVEELQTVTRPIPRNVQRFLEMPPPPPAVRELLEQAPTTSAWDRMDFLRQTLLQTVVATGAGTPVSVPPEKVQDMLAGSKQGSPFEIVAGQAMLARWAGVPARIGYGFDGGEPAGEQTYDVRPKHGATFLEVYFPGFKWLPVIGDPAQAKPSLNQSEQQNRDLAPSDEVAIELLVPTATPPRSVLLDQIRRIVLIAVLVLLLLALTYFSYPAIRKPIIRARRRTRARREGVAARIALAYAEWRDFTADLGYRHESDTPLMFLSRVATDREHSTFAWLVTRTLWGDLNRDLVLEDALNAEELSRSLKKRTAQAHAWSIRLIALFSRQSLKRPFAPPFLAKDPAERRPDAESKEAA